MQIQGGSLWPEPLLFVKNLLNWPWSFGIWKTSLKLTMKDAPSFARSWIRPCPCPSDVCHIISYQNIFFNIIKWFGDCMRDYCLHCLNHAVCEYILHNHYQYLINLSGFFQCLCLCNISRCTCNIRGILTVNRLNYFDSTHTRLNQVMWLALSTWAYGLSHIGEWVISKLVSVPVFAVQNVH
jgi:hypothetical protein